jgi:RNA polymerase sigma-70 factor (ECF subfamily)
LNDSPAIEARLPAAHATYNNEEIEALFAHYTGLRALILRRVRDPDLAADILQDAALTTLVKLRRGEIEHPEQVGGYIYRVALNHLRNYRRKDRSAVQTSEVLEELPDLSLDHAADVLRRDQWAAAAARVLAEMPVARDRELLIRYYLDEEESGSIRASLRLTEEHFHRVIFRARVRFRALLERKGFRRSDFYGALVAIVGLLLALGSGVESAISPALSRAPAPWQFADTSRDATTP